MLYNVAQAAELLGIHPQTLRNWDRSGKFVALKTPGGQRRIIYCVTNKISRKKLDAA